MRIGAIANYEEVRAFFDSIQRPVIGGNPIDTLDSIDRLEVDQQGVLLELDRAGRVTIETAKVVIEHDA